MEMQNTNAEMNSGRNGSFTHIKHCSRMGAGGCSTTDLVTFKIVLRTPWNRSNRIFRSRTHFLHVTRDEVHMHEMCKRKMKCCTYNEQSWWRWSVSLFCICYRLSLQETMEVYKTIIASWNGFYLPFAGVYTHISNPTH